LSQAEPGRLASLGCLIGLFLLAPPLNAAEFSFSTDREAGRLEISYGGQKLLVAAFAANQFKPYVKELYTLKGDNVLLDAPPDHLHHHGLMYAIRVNGANFWEETPGCGFQRLIAQETKTGRSPDGLPQALLVQTIHWVTAPDSKLTDTSDAALLRERRAITLTVDETRREVALAWKSEFEAGRRAPKTLLSGAGYHGLGLRFPRAFDLVAKHQNSAGVPYSAEQKWDVTPAQWSAVSHVLNGHDVLVALFNQPANKGECKFFTMLNAFAYLSATQDLEKTPLEYGPGDKFSLCYLLTLYTEAKSREFLAQRQQLWLQQGR
jgi:hypothetical protein